MLSLRYAAKVSDFTISLPDSDSPESFFLYFYLYPLPKFGMITLSYQFIYLKEFWICFMMSDKILRTIIIIGV